MNRNSDVGWDALRDTLFNCFPTAERQQIAAQAVLWMGTGVLMQALNSAVDSGSMIHIYTDNIDGSGC